MAKLIELDNLTKEYNGQVVLKGIHLDINEKELINVLSKFKNSKIFIKSEGTVSSLNTINKLFFDVQFGVLKLSDKLSKNNCLINLGQIYQIKLNQYKNIIKLYLDKEENITIFN